jgi:hypothetical protein
MALCFSLRIVWNIDMRLAASVLNIAMCAAAFGVVALIAVFGHPGARPGRMPTAITAPAANETVRAEFKPAVLSRRGTGE